MSKNALWCDTKVSSRTVNTIYKKTAQHTQTQKKRVTEINEFSFI